MNSIQLFYKPPKDEYFDELKRLCIRFWEVYEEYPLFTEHAKKLIEDFRQSKINQIKDLRNEGTNFMSMILMIHPMTRKVIAKHLSLETRNEISMRLYGCEEENEFDPFNIWNIKNNIYE